MPIMINEGPYRFEAVLDLNLESDLSGLLSKYFVTTQQMTPILRIRVINEINLRFKFLRRHKVAKNKDYRLICYILYIVPLVLCAFAPA